MPTRVVVFNEAIHPDYPAGAWRLCLQWVRYMKDDGEIQDGYRFIWRRPDNSLQAARGQARIPSRQDAERLFQMARDGGWGDHVGQQGGGEPVE
jgi:hypothetical protein